MTGQVTVLKGGRLLDGNGGEPIDPSVLIFEENRIKWAGPLALLEKIPDSWTIVDVTGKTIMPGLIDAHLHFLGITSLNPFNWIVDPPELRAIRIVPDAWRLLDAGFTTVRCCGSSYSLHLKKAVAESCVMGPRVVCCGAMISQTGGHGDLAHFLPIEWIRSPRGWGRMADGVAECRKAAREQLREGADFIKLCASGGVTSERDLPTSSQFSLEEIQAIVEEAHAVGAKCAAHAQGTAGIKNALRAGVDSIEHGYYLDDECIEMMQERKTYLIPTLSIAHATLTRGLGEDIPRATIEKARGVHEAQLKSFERAYRAGIPIGCGTDYLGHRMCPMGENALELELQVRFGRSPMDVIVSATKINSEILGLDKELGTLESGKRADVIVVAGDPLRDISVLRGRANIVGVYKDGIDVRAKFQEQMGFVT